MIMKLSSVYAIVLLLCLTWRTGHAKRQQRLIKPDIVPEIITSAITAAGGKGKDNAKKSSISGKIDYFRNISNQVT